jgi:hypothetical protein
MRSRRDGRTTQRARRRPRSFGAIDIQLNRSQIPPFEDAHWHGGDPGRDRITCCTNETNFISVNGNAEKP